MKPLWHKTTYYLTVCAVVAAAFLPQEIVEVFTPIRERIIASHAPSTTRILLVGDIMLGRHVERLMGELGADYPFAGIGDTLSAADITIGNFEGVIPEVHVPTLSGGMQFSMQEYTLEQLADTGFDVLSLANNHSSDYGQSAYLRTHALCETYALVCRGHASRVDFETSTARIDHDEHTVGIFFIHTLFAPPTAEEVRAVLAELSSQSDIQIAYVHWGDEYERVHAPAQERLAHTLIDSGADIVVGHHPHVVQDVVIYKNAPILYSLGNFIFDQYFSTDVQEGLVATLTLEKGALSVTLDGVTSIGTRSQPRHMTGTEERMLMARILAPLEGDLRVDHDARTIRIPLVAEEIAP